jgi:O-antigen ligase
VQAGIAIAQFALQKDLGLVNFGELPLNPLFEGITVLYARGQPWLRAYGLTAHPNLLGALLAMLLLWLLPMLGRLRGVAQWLLLAVISIGLLGLFVSFSRSAWLAFGCGLFTWLLGRRRLVTRRPLTHAIRPSWTWLPFGLLLIPVLALLAFNYDLVLSRFIALDTPIEAQSLNQRWADDRLAMEIIGRYPWRGVGMGNYEQLARTIEPKASRVHNVPLYVTAELGLGAGLLWLWLMIPPFLWWWRGRFRSPSAGPSITAAQLAPWVAMIVMNMFDTMVWWSSNWQTAVLFALLIAQITPGYQLAAPSAVGNELTQIDTNKT